MSLVIFSHGKESGPNGNKILTLKKVAERAGFKTISIDYRNCNDANERLVLLRNVISEKKSQSIILVGSSMGGYLSTVMSCENIILGLFLLCPALYMPSKEYEVQEYYPKCDNIEIIHGWNDEVVPYQNSIKFASRTKAVLNIINDNHRLNDSYLFMKHRFALYLELTKT